MLVIHRVSELLKLADRAPAPAHRVWAVRSVVVALLVALLVVSNAALAASLGRARGRVPDRQLELPWRTPEADKLQELWGTEWRTPLREPLGTEWRTPLRKPLGTEWRTPLREPLGTEGRTPLRKLLGTEWRTPLREPLGTEWRTLPRLPDGRYALPPLNQSESKEPASLYYRQTKTILQQYPEELLKRGADGRFQSISMSTTTPELRNRHVAAMTDVLATAVYNEISTLQSSASPTQSTSGKIELSVTNLKSSLLKLPIGEKSAETPSVAKRGEYTGANLSEVSSIDVQGDSPNTLLDVELKPQEGQRERYLVRANLDAMINTINTDLDGFLNAPRPP